MELFSEIYSLYFRAMERLLHSANKRPLTGAEVQKALSEGTFSESSITMFPKLQNGVWPLLRRMESGYTAACVPPDKMPLTLLQRAWIKALLDDPRIRLFLDGDETEKLRSSLSDMAPLYKQEHFYVFDKATDSDDYENPEYRRCFRLFLRAIHQKAALSVLYEGGKGNRVSGLFWPYRLEYSAKDDKFRAHCYRKIGGKKMISILNMGRVASVETADTVPSDLLSAPNTGGGARFRQVTLEITKERNALERCMVHFAHFEKRTEYDEAADKYTCTIQYNVMDETEIVIRVLSFGPTIKVLGPDEFIGEVRTRVKRQAEWLERNTVLPPNAEQQGAFVQQRQQTQDM